MHGPRRALVVATCLLLVWITGVATAGPAAAASPSDEQGLVSRINQERSSRGLRTLIVDVAIRDVARGWSDHMAATGDFSHNPSYKSQMPSGWSKTGENVAWGSGGNANVDYIHRSLMNSSGHRANILGDFTRVGVGVTIASNGRMYVTEDFGKYDKDGSGSSATTATTRDTPTTAGARSTGHSTTSTTQEASASGRTVAPAKGRATTATTRKTDSKKTTAALATTKDGKKKKSAAVVQAYRATLVAHTIRVVYSPEGITCIGDCLFRRSGRLQRSF